MAYSFIFYRSFYDAIKLMPEGEREKVYEAIAEYSLDGIEPALPYPASMAWALIKPQIDANTRRAENGKLGAEYGKLGGRPKKTTDTTENPIGVMKKNPIGVISENPTGETEETPNKNNNKNKNQNNNENQNVVVPETDSTDYKRVVNAWHSIAKSYPKVVALSDRRKQAIKARLKAHSYEEIEKAFEIAEASDFLKGQNKNNWTADFDWIVGSEQNMLKILEGKYGQQRGGNKDSRMVEGWSNAIGFGG